jgi:hypothetical protein
LFKYDVYIKNKFVKRLLLSVIVIFSGIGLYAQWLSVPNLTTFDERNIHFGFTLGINTMDFGLVQYNSLDENPKFSIDSIKFFNNEIDSVNHRIRADIASLVPGFTVGIVSNLRLTKYLDLRFIPGLSFGNRKLVFNLPIHDISNQGGVLKEYSARATFLDFPLLLKYKSKRIVNQRPYMLGGVALRYDISKSATADLVQLNKTLFSIEAGMGWDIYLQFFRLSTELKYSFGIGNNLSSKLPKAPQYQYYQMAFKRLSSNIFTLSFHFE